MHLTKHCIPDSEAEVCHLYVVSVQQQKNRVHKGLFLFD